MKIKILCKNEMQEVDLPNNPLAIGDILDRVSCEPGQNAVEFTFLDDPLKTGLPAKLCGKVFRGDIYMLNVFAQRFEDMDEVHRAMLAAVVQTHETDDLQDLVRMTYGLDSLPVIPAEDFAEVGEYCIDMDMLPIIENCSDELLPLLDREKVGRMMAEQSGGVIVNGIYCETSSFEMPDIQFSFGSQSEIFFRLRIGPDTPDGEQQSQWLTLPCPTDTLDKFSETGIPIKQMCCYEYQTALPQLTWYTSGGMENIYALNALAHHLSGMGQEQVVKLKAVMENQNLYTLDDTLELVRHLGEYDFDPAVSDSDAYAERYLCRNVPEGFDASVLRDAELFDLGEALLARKHGSLTSYGAVCHGELYSMIETQDSDLMEECNEGMVGIQ